MATISAPRGLVPISKLGGRADPGSPRLYKVPASYATSIGNGDPVTIKASSTNRGSIMRTNETTTATTVTSSGTIVGVCGGVQYTSTTSPYYFTTSHWYQATNAATDIYMFVWDDPDQLFMIQANGAVPQTALGCNAAIIQTAVTNTSNGNSGLQLQASSVDSTSTLPLRIVDFYIDAQNSVNDAYTMCVVRLNTHFHRTATGVAAS